MRGAALAVWLLLAGCGRVDFDAIPTDASDALVPAPVPVELHVDSFSTTSATFTDIPGAGLTIPVSPGTTWLLLVTAALESSSFSEITVEARYLVDGVERGIGGTQNTTAGKPGPWQHFYVHAGGDTASSVTVQLRDAKSATATIENLRVIAIPLPAGSDPLYASADAVHMISGPSFVDVETLTLTPSGAGDYLVFLLSNSSDAPSKSNVYTQWLDPGGAIWVDKVHMPREPWQSFFSIRRTTIGPAPATLTFQGYTGDTMLGQASYIRALALRTDAFPSFDATLEIANQTAGTPTAVTTATLAPAPSLASNFLAYESMRVEELCSDGITAERNVVFDFGGGTPADSITHANDNCTYEETFGGMRLLSAAPAQMSITIASPNSAPFDALESALVLLGLP